MKRYSNLDIDGKLKLRGKFSGSLSAEGGFYSNQFGEAAYRADIPVSEATGFYGINVKLTNNAVAFKGINTVVFDAEDFYLEPVDGDEVTVTLKEAIKHVAYDPGLVSNTATQTARHDIDLFRLNIGTNELPVARSCRVNVYGQISWIVTSTEFYLVTYFDNQIVHKWANGQAFGSANDLGLFQSLIVTQAAPTTAFITIENTVGSSQTATTGDMGIDGAGLSTTKLLSSVMLDSTPDHSRELRVTTRWESRAAGLFVNRYYMTVEYL